jgi:Immunity protein 8
MIVPELRDISTYAGDSLELAKSELGRAFCASLVAHIGMRGREGADLFYFRVCSPKTIEAGLRGQPQFLIHTMIVDRFDPVAVRRTIEELCSETSGETWPEVATKLSRFMQWEFDNYSPAEAESK